MSSNDLHETKQRLLQKLGPSYSSYVQLLGKWFRGIISKEEFDKAAKQLVEHNFVFEHNKFWLAFFQHCANNASKSIQSHNHFRLNDKLSNHYELQRDNDKQYGLGRSSGSPESFSDRQNQIDINHVGIKVRCLPNRVITQMRILVIAWEMGLDSVNDNVPSYIDLALHHFLKNIITELICTKTAYRMRENRFKYAFGVKPMNPYLSNSLKVYTSNLEYDPYQIESNKMNSSLVDTYAYNDSLFPSRLYEAQALYEYACSTTTVMSHYNSKPKRPKLSEIFLGQDEKHNHCNIELPSIVTVSNFVEANQLETYQEDGCQTLDEDSPTKKAKDKVKLEESGIDEQTDETKRDERKLTLYHLLLAFLSDRTIIPSQSLYTINLERIFSKSSR